MSIITERTTPQRLGAPAPDTTTIARAIEAAEAAPDHGRLKPWRFIVIEQQGLPAFGQLMAEALLQREPTASAEAVEKERNKPLRTPLIIVVAVEVVPGRIPEYEQILAGGAAAQNLQLAFHAEGFGVQWKTGAPTFDIHVKAGLGLKAADHIIGFMYVGTITEAGRPRSPHDGSRIRHWP